MLPARHPNRMRVNNSFQVHLKNLYLKIHYVVKSYSNFATTNI